MIGEVFGMCSKIGLLDVHSIGKSAKLGRLVPPLIAEAQIAGSVSDKPIYSPALSLRRLAGVTV